MFMLVDVLPMRCSVDKLASATAAVVNSAEIASDTAEIFVMLTEFP
jgi:hypothetical protein